MASGREVKLSCHYTDAVCLFERRDICPKKNETRGVMPLRGQTVRGPRGEHDVVFTVAPAHFSKNIIVKRSSIAGATMGLDDGQPRQEFVDFYTAFLPCHQE